jgi:hypothetical protein
MPANEIPPGGRLASLRYGRDAMPAQNVAHGLVGDYVAQVGQHHHNPIVTPARVFMGQANHQILNLGTDAWSARRAAVFRAIELFGTRLAIQPRMVSFGEARHLQQPFALQTLADFRQRGPLAVRQPQIPRRMCLQNPGLGRQILILQQEFLIDQCCNVRQELRPCGFVCLLSPS